jgi:hypothetical protein
MRLHAAVLCTLALLLLTTTGASAARWPPLDSMVRMQHRVKDLNRENVRLRKRNHRLLRKLAHRERQLAATHRAMRERLHVSGGLVSAFLCIHHFEGAWTAATGNGYHGGLQMDSSFMATYGRNFQRAWGGAEHWPPFVQLAVGINAYLSGRGFHPWPNTARACGLIG